MPSNLSAAIERMRHRMRNWDRDAWRDFLLMEARMRELEEWKREREAEPLTVRGIIANMPCWLFADKIADWLQENGFDGLWNEDGEPHCGCGGDDLFCGEGCPQPDCMPAYRHKDGMYYLEEEPHV